MNEILVFVLVFAAGIALGMLFFGGLWFTVKRMPTVKMPALWVMSSFFLRIAITLAGFYYIASGSWQTLLACLLGFVAARFLVIRLTKSNNEIQLNKEAHHEA